MSEPNSATSHDDQAMQTSDLEHSLSRAQELLLEFLRDHDAACPLCGYNLRTLTRPVCPECKQELTLTVGTTGLRLAWLLITLIPGAFSGIAACFVAIPTVGGYFEDGIIVWPFVLAVLFGWCSGVFTIVLIMKRIRFISQTLKQQRRIAIIVWGIHLAAGLLFFGWVASQI